MIAVLAAVAAAWWFGPVPDRQVSGFRFHLLSTAARDDLHAAARAVGVPASSRLTPAQALAMLDLVTPDTAEQWIGYWQQRADEAQRCWEFRHEQEIEHWRTRALVAEQQQAAPQRSVRTIVVNASPGVDDVRAAVRDYHLRRGGSA